MKLLIIIQREYQISSTITSVSLVRRFKKKKNIHIKIILITSQMKILILFSFHQLTKKKLNSFSPPLISTNLINHIVFKTRFWNYLKIIFLNSLLSYLDFLFTTIWKTYILIYNERSKLNFINYRPVSLLSNFDKILETYV